MKYGDIFYKKVWTYPKSSRLKCIFRKSIVPYTACKKPYCSTCIPTKRMLKEIAVGVRVKRKNALIPIIEAWAADFEHVPTNYKDRNWKQFSKKKKQWE